MKKTRVIKISPIFIIIVVFIFFCIIIKLTLIGLGNVKVNNQTLTAFAKSRDTRKRTLYAKRGSIYSKSGEILAKDVNSYTVIAYLEPSRTKDPNKPYHVVDKEKTAEALSPIINMTKERILSLLNTKIETCNEDKTTCVKTVPYQVELGPGGRGITELTKDQIDALDLPGIDFIASTKRYYPNGDFLSYTLGYAKKINDEFVGEMGVELYYNDELTGENGYIEYQSDPYGYQITSTPSAEKTSVSGNDVYLTIDDNIQMFTEQAMNIIDEGNPEWAIGVVANAKTGEILGVSSSPSFNNNELNIKSYYDPFVSYAYEPGSTLKIFSFMAAMDNGIYNGSETYKSGFIQVDDAKIRDWNNYGWGTITYDEGFMGSSNVAASNLALKLGRAKLMDYYTNLGFGSKTGINLPNETSGVVNFKYNTEIASASFGQGVTVSGIQMVQALTTLANKGIMLKPYIVSKVVNSETGELIFENKRTEVRQISNEQTVNKMLGLMRGVVEGGAKMATGTGYYVKGMDLVGKTGTAEIASSSGGYLSGSYNRVRSFAGVFPGQDPQVIVYIAASKISNANLVKEAIKSLVKDVGTYLNINNETNETELSTYTTKSYLNKDVKTVSESLKSVGMKPIVIGEGNKVIKQYPSQNVEMNLNNKIFLLTASDKYKMLDITSWSRSEVQTYCKLLNIDVNFTGYGYVKSYTINKDTELTPNMSLEVELQPKFN